MRKIKLIEHCQTLDAQKMKSIIGGEESGGVTITCPIPRQCQGYYYGILKTGACVYDPKGASVNCGCMYYLNGEPHPLMDGPWSFNTVSCWVVNNPDSGSGN